MCPYKVSLNIKFEGFSSKKMISGIPKMPKSWPAIVHIFNEVWCPSLIPSKILTKMILIPKNWNPMKSIQVIIRTPSTHDRVPKFINKRVKNSGKKNKYWNSAKPGTYIMCPHKVSLNIKFEGSSWKIDWKKWPAIMRIHMYLMRYDAHIQSHPRSSLKWYIYTEEIRWKELEFKTADGRTDEQGESSIPPPPSGGYNNICEPDLNVRHLHHYTCAMRNISQLKKI